MSSNGSPVGSIRRRTRLACNPCKRRKKKCDGAFPCKACCEFEYQCSYEGQADEPPHEPQPAVPTSKRARDESPPAPTPPAKRGTHDMYDPHKDRFWPATSAITFPRELALSSHGTNPPRFHSFAYNVGVVEEHWPEKPTRRLSDFLTLAEAQKYAGRYFETVNRFMRVVDEETILESLPVVWDADLTVITSIESVACYVILLGSCFSWPNTAKCSAELVQYGLEILPLTNFRDASTGMRVMELQGFILRTIYLRCTTRPHQVWHSSCVALHFAETLGLHLEYDIINSERARLTGLGEDHKEMRRRLFWIAWALNRMVSVELCRSATHVTDIHCNLPKPSKGNSTASIIEAFRILFPGGSLSLAEDREKTLLDICELARTGGAQDPMLSLVCSQIACGLCRQVHYHSIHLDPKTFDSLKACVRAGFDAARQCLADPQPQPWWMVVSLPFEFLCVALAIGKQSVLELLPEAVDLLERNNAVFNSNMTREAYDTAQRLLKMAADAKDEELAMIRKAQRTRNTPTDGYVPTFDGGGDEDWTMFLEDNDAFKFLGSMNIF